MNSNSSNGSLEIENENGTEGIILSTYFLLLAMVSSSLNGLVIYLTRKHSQFHEAYMYVRAAYACFDIVFAVSIALHYLVNLYVPAVPPLLTCATGDFAIALFFATTQLTAFIALERYFYFCRPLVYHRYFNLRSIAISAVGIFAVTQGYVFVKEVLYGRELQALIAMCVFTQPAQHNITNLMVFVLPAVMVTGFSVARICSLLRRLATVTPHGAAATTEPRLRRQVLKKSLRLIFLVSGAFWGTYIPAFVTRTVIFQLGYTWQSLNAYDHPLVSSILRYSHFSIALSTVLDPIIYFAVCRDLRTALRRLCGSHGTFTWENQ